MIKSFLVLIVSFLIVGCAATVQPTKESQNQSEHSKDVQSSSKSNAETVDIERLAKAIASKDNNPSGNVGPDELNNIYKGLLETSGSVRPSPAAVASSSPAPILKLSKNPPSMDIMLARSFIYREDKDLKNTFSVLLLPKKPSNKALVDKYNILCEEYLSNFAHMKETKQSGIVTTWVPFYWLINLNVAQESCDSMIKNYDYVRSQFLAKQFKLDITKTYLVFRYLDTTITMDLSNLNKEDDLITAMTVWKSNMTTLPTKDRELSIVNMIYSTKAILGSLSALLTMN